MEDRIYLDNDGKVICNSNGAIKIPNTLFRKYLTDSEEYSINASDLTGIDTIPNYAFYNCNKLISVEIPSSVTSIGTGTFYYCSNLENITIPDSVMNIRDNAFTGCNKLIYTSNSINYIKTTTNNYYGAYSGTSSSATSIQIASGCKFILYVNSRGAFQGYNKLTSVSLPDTLIEIGTGAFSNCSSLTALTLPDSVTRIGIDAFAGCSSLSNVTIGNSVTNIGAYSFYRCSNLTSITIPNSVTSIGASAFSGCSSLTQITILATTPPTLSRADAISTATTTIYVPYGTKSTYENANVWKILLTRPTNPVTFVELPQE